MTYGYPYSRFPFYAHFFVYVLFLSDMYFLAVFVSLGFPPSFFILLPDCVVLFSVNSLSLSHGLPH